MHTPLTCSISNHLRRAALTQRRVRATTDYCLGFGFGEAGGAAGADATGVTPPAGTTPAPEAGAADPDGFAAAGDADGSAALCCLSSSCRSPVSRLALCAYKIDKVKVRAKKIPANQPVNLTSTLVVCAPKIFSVTPPPKAAPSPSLFGRCIRMTSIMRTATNASITSRQLIRMDIGTGNMAKAADLSTAKAEPATSS